MMGLRSCVLFCVCVLLWVVFPAVASTFPVPSGTWQQGGSLSTPRSFATATLLSDGRVVIAGGEDAKGNALATVEIFQANGTISAGAPMGTARYGHSAVLLGDGRLLVAGGHTTGGAVLKTAEIFDPSSNSWTSIASPMTDARADFTMSALSSGDALVIGGDNGSGPVGSIDRFSLSAGTFSPQAALSVPRKLHAASVLRDGRIVVTGGMGVGQGAASIPVSLTEIYDPVANTVTAGPSLNTARFAHTATTLVDNTILIAGGNNGSADLASIEIFDPAAGKMATASATLATPRSGQVALLLPNNGGVLIAGGTSAGTALASTELYQSWNAAILANGAMSAARQGAATSALQFDGAALVTGGSSSASSDLYGFATVKTDAADYAPGTPVNITGAGWVPGETVTLTLLESPYYDTHPPMTAVADAQGNIANSSFAPDSHDLNIRFYLTAAGSQSQAYNTFTDSNPNTITVPAQSPNPVVPGGSAVYNPVTFAFNGNSNSCSVTPSVSGLPTGATAAFNPSTITSSGATISSQLTITTTSSVLGGTYPITVNVTPVAGTSCQGNRPVGSGTLVIAAKTTTTVLTSSLNPSTFGAPVTFVATVTGTGSTLPTGTVTFMDGTMTLGTGTLVAGASSSAASFTTSALSVSGHTITAVYGGDSNFFTSTSAALSETVNKAASTAVVSSSSTTSAFGSAVTFTTTVTGVANAAVPTGSVAFMDGTTTLGTVALTAGSASSTATFMTSSLSVSGHTITVVYSGDTNYLTSTSAALTQTVNKAGSAAVLVSSLNPSTYGTPVSFNVTVTGVNGSAVPSGSVTLMDGTNSLGTAALAPGTGSSTASFLLASLSAGVHNLTAVFSGDANYLGVTSAAVSQTVSKATPSVAWSTPTAITYGTPLSATQLNAAASFNQASVAGSFTYTPAVGTVLATGNQTLSVHFVPSDTTDFNPVDATVTLNVQKAALTLTANSMAKTYGQVINFAGTEFTTSGLLNGDTVTGVSLASVGAAASAGVNGSPYAIVPSGAVGTGLGNYNIVYVNGSLTVSPATLSLHLTGTGGMYTSMPYTASCSIAGGLVNNDSVTLTVTYSSGTAPINVGSYTANCSSSGNPNYQAASAQASIVIAPAPLTITASNQSMSFGGAAPTFGATYTGLLGMDTPAVIAGLTFTTFTDASLGSAVTSFPTLKAGAYPIVPSGAVAANYTIQYVNGTLTVNKAVLTGTVTISPADPSTVQYGHPATASVLLNGYNIGGVDVLQSHADPANPGNMLPPSMTVYLIPANGGPSQAIKFGTATAVATYDNSANTSGSTRTGWSAVITGNAPPPGQYTAVVYGDDPGDKSLSNLNLADGGYFFTDTADISYPTLNSNVLTVVPADLTIRANSTSKTYGQTVTFNGNEFTTSGLVNDDAVTSVTLTSAGAAATAGVNGSPYAIVPSAAVGTGLTNYNIVYTNGSLTVNPASLTITANDRSKVYGQTVSFAGTEFHATGVLNGDAVASVTLTSAGAASAATVTSPGPTYAIVPSAATGTGLGNYTIAYSNGTLTVTPASASVTPNKATKVYGTSDPTLSGTLTGFIASDNVTATYSRTAGETVLGGPYTISAVLSPTAVLGNYNITYNTAAFTITPAPASVTPAAASKVYGTSDPGLTGTLAGFLAGDGVTATYTRAAGETVTGGPYIISATLSPAAVLSNYNVTYKTAAFTITPAPASVTPSAASKVYGTADPALTGTLAGFLAGDGVTATYTRAAGETVKGGPYAISATLSSAPVLSNYNVTYNTAAFTITPAPASVTPAAASKVYGAADPALSGTLTGFLSADGVTATYTRAAGETVTGGPYTILATLSPAVVLSNYNVTYNTAAFTITPAPASVTPTAASKVYGTADPALTGTLTGFVAGDGVTAAYTRVAGETVKGGPYAISATLSPAAVLSNYNVTYNTAAFTITPAPASVTPAAASKVYGTADPALTGTLTGFVAGDGVTATYTRAAGETVTGGPYTISATLSPTAVLSNYNVTYNAAAFTITAAPASVTPNALSKTYGTADPALTGTLNGFLAGDNVQATYSRTPGESAGGAYTISATLSPTAVLSNYSVTYNTAAFTINKANASVTPTALSKVYGTADPTLTGTLTGFIASDNITATYTRATGNTVLGGPYTISATLSPAAALTNYNVTYNTAQFTITPAQASVTPIAASKVYGAADPTLTGTMTGFVAADNVTATYTRAAGETVKGGPYSIWGTLSPAGVLSNYSITYNTANFTITPAPLTVTANNLSMIYGGALPTYSYSMTGFVRGDTQATATTGAPALTTNPAVPVSVGSYVITAAAGSLASSNYSFNFVNGTLSILYSMGACDGDLGHSILQPIAANGSSTFKQGSTIPAKFRVCDANGNSVGNPGVVQAFNIVQTIRGTVSTEVDAAVDSSTPDTMFRWDPTAQQWIFNISSKNMSTQTTYIFAITLNDGSVINFSFGLPK